eukprot:12065198-Alexandrium_andersonii.AAC.1
MSASLVGSEMCIRDSRKGVRPLDVLTVFKKTLPAGSIRLRTYETFIDRARRQGRLPLNAKS